MSKKQIVSSIHKIRNFKIVAHKTKNKLKNFRVKYKIKNSKLMFKKKRLVLFKKNSIKSFSFKKKAMGNWL